MKITIISGTNRTGNLTDIFTNQYHELLTNQGIDSSILKMQDFEKHIDFKLMYDYDNSPVKDLAETYIQPADGLVFIIPEYNGSYPGILKLFIDSIHPDYFKNKVASVIGIASGRAGNLRGIDHLKSVLHHLNVHLIPNTLPISQIYNLINENKMITDDVTLNLLENDTKQLVNAITKYK